MYPQPSPATSEKGESGVRGLVADTLLRVQRNQKKAKLDFDNKIKIG